MEIIHKAAELDSEVKSMVIIAICTGLRLKDICLLEWRSIDFVRNLVSLHTYKTGGNVALGMWPLLYNELKDLAARSREAERAATKYVLPEIAGQYLKNPKVLKDRLNRVLFALGYTGAKPKELRNVKNRKPAQILKLALEKIESSIWTEGRKERVREIVTRYLKGKTVHHVAREMKVSTGTISMNLNALEELSGMRILRRIKLTGQTEETPEGRGRLNSDKTGRARGASLRGWHSFRVSFVVEHLTQAREFQWLSKNMQKTSTLYGIFKTPFLPLVKQYTVGKEPPSL